MSVKTFHEHGATEIRMTVLKHHRRSYTELQEANPQKEKETDEAYEKRIDALYEKTAKRVDFHIFEADAALTGQIKEMVQKAEDGHKYECTLGADGKLKELKKE